MKTCGMYDPNKVFGVSSVLEMRANTIVGDYLSIDPAAVKVPIVGGTTACTAVPLLSHSTPYNEFTYVSAFLLLFWQLKKKKFLIYSFLNSRMK